MPEFMPTVTDASGKPLKGNYNYIIDYDTGKVTVNVIYTLRPVEPEIIDAKFLEERLALCPTN